MVLLGFVVGARFFGNPNAFQHNPPHLITVLTAPPIGLQWCEQCCLPKVRAHGEAIDIIFFMQNGLNSGGMWLRLVFNVFYRAQPAPVPHHDHQFPLNWPGTFMCRFWTRPLSTQAPPDQNEPNFSNQVTGLVWFGISLPISTQHHILGGFRVQHPICSFRVTKQSLKSLLLPSLLLDSSDVVRNLLRRNPQSAKTMTKIVLLKIKHHFQADAIMIY